MKATPCRSLLKTLAAAVLALSPGALLAAETAAAERPAVIDAAKYVDRALADCGLQRAIDEAAAAGGGVARLPAGTFALRRGLLLKSGVEIVGAGMDKTILTPAREVVRLDLAQDGPDKEGRLRLKNLPEALDAGSAVVGCDSWPPSWYGAPRPGFVESVDRDAKTIVVKWPYGAPGLRAGRGCLVYGDAAALDQPIVKGATEIALKNAALFRPGDEVTIGEPGNESMLSHGFVQEVRGHTLVLDAPARVDFAAWPDAKVIGNKKVNALIWTVFPMIHNANIKNAAVRDLTIQGQMRHPVYTTQGRYTVSGLHLFNAVNVTIERVAVRDWPADGISLQTGDKCVVRACEATGCAGNGLHPGTGLTNTLIEDCLARDNGSGLYFCWHNRGHVLRKNRFLENRGGGITGLGNPGDRHNTIEENLIARNGGPGIEINGGQKSGNVIRNNIIENNSQGKPGKAPGIALYASTENALDFTITGNIIRDTQETPTQWVGIEEKNGKYRDQPTRADENVIRGNTFAGHRTADIILANAKTVVEENGEAKVVKPPADAAAVEAGKQ